MIVLMVNGSGASELDTLDVSGDGSIYLEGTFMSNAIVIYIIIIPKAISEASSVLSYVV